MINNNDDFFENFIVHSNVKNLFWFKKGQNICFQKETFSRNMFKFIYLYIVFQSCLKKESSCLAFYKKIPDRESTVFHFHRKIITSVSNFDGGSLKHGNKYK